MSGSLVVVIWCTVMLGALVWALLALLRRGERAEDRMDERGVGAFFPEYLPGDVVTVIQPGVPRRMWPDGKVQAVSVCRNDLGKYYTYQVNGVHYRGESLQAVSYVKCAGGAR